MWTRRKHMKLQDTVTPALDRTRDTCLEAMLHSMPPFDLVTVVQNITYV